MSRRNKHGCVVCHNIDEAIMFSMCCLFNTNKDYCTTCLIETSKMTKSISQSKRNQIVGMAAGGTPLRRVAAHFRLHRNTVSKIVNLHRRTGNVAERRRSDRPRVTTPEQARFIRTVHLRYSRAYDYYIVSPPPQNPC